MDPGTSVERGDVYRVALRGAGHELSGPHYAVVVSDEPYNWLSTVVVVPFSTGARAFSVRPEAVIRGTRARALVDQVRVVDRRLLRDRIASLAGTATLAEIDEQLRLLLALDA